MQDLATRVVAKSIKVIDKSEEAVEPRYQAILPTAEKRKSSPSAALAGFTVEKRMRPGK
jgi:hypothetical protein